MHDAMSLVKATLHIVSGSSGNRFSPGEAGCEASGIRCRETSRGLFLFVALSNILRCKLGVGRSATEHDCKLNLDRRQLEIVWCLLPCCCSGTYIRYS